MKCLILDNAVLSYISLKLRLEAMGAEVQTIAYRHVRDYEREFNKDALETERLNEIDFIFVSAYVSGDLNKFVNNVLRNKCSKAKIIVTYARGETSALPSVYVVKYDNVLMQPYSDEELRKVIFS